MDNRNKEPRTIREKLESIASFRPAMQGGGSISTFIPVQPNRIDKDPLVGSDMGRLVDALRPWDKALARHSKDVESQKPGAVFAEKCESLKAL